MKVILHRRFKKAYKKLKEEECRKFTARRDLFIKDPFHPILNNHALMGKFEGYRSINITGDLRVHYEPLSEGVAMFINIGTHHELYGK